jgi:hypothetical protein
MKITNGSKRERQRESETDAGVKKMREREK